MPTLYFDACCLNRPFDDQTSERVRLESEAILLILKRVESGEWQWISSEALVYEVNQTPDAERRARLASMLSSATHLIPIEEKETRRAKELEKLGLRSFDALHLACAESGDAEIFLTTDDRVLRLAARATMISMRVENPLVWLREVGEK